MCKAVARYNEATGEQTEADKAAYLEQAKYVAKFDKMMNEGKIEKVVVMKKEEMEEIEDAWRLAADTASTGAESNDEEDFSEYLDAGRYSEAGVASV